MSCEYHGVDEDEGGDGDGDGDGDDCNNSTNNRRNTHSTGNECLFTECLSVCLFVKSENSQTHLHLFV